MPQFLTIVVVAIILNVIGMVWYGPVFFGKAWMRVMGVDTSKMSPEVIKEKQKGMAGLYIVNFLLSVVTVAVLAWALGDETRVTTAMKLSAVIWLGFSMPMQASGALWSGKPKSVAWEMFIVSAGYQLVAFLVAGALLVLW